MDYSPTYRVSFLGRENTKISAKPTDWTEIYKQCPTKVCRPLFLWEEKVQPKTLYQSGELELKEENHVPDSDLVTFQ